MRAALLLVDLQHDFLAAQDLEPSAASVVWQSARLLEQWRRRGWPVVHVWTTTQREPDDRMPHWQRANDWRCEQGTAGERPPPALVPAAAEEVVHKQFFSAFSTGRLEAVLREASCETLVLAGVHLHGCIRSTLLDAYARGFQTVVAEDAVGGYDALHGTQTREYLDGRAGRFYSVQEICAAAGEEALATLFLPPANDFPREIDAVFQTAKSALAGWQSLPLPHRQQTLVALAHALQQHAEELAQILVADIGKPISQARREVVRAVDLLLAVAANVSDAPANGWRRLPLGVVALVTPFNNPLAIAVGKLAPALLHGNVVVWKPAPPGLRIALRTLELFQKTLLPPNVLQVVAGGQEAAAACMKRADAVTISGSPEAGRVAQLICGRRMIPLQAELGGNNAAIVWRDADLSHAAAQIAEGAFGFAGQRCTANRRVVVDAAVYDEFVQRLREQLPHFVPGDPADESTKIGPVISETSRARLAALVQRAAHDGCEIFSLETDALTGRWFAPRIICAAVSTLEIVQEESFGPILVVQKAADWEEAIALCNGVRQGLAAACFTADARRIDDFLSRAQAGILKINQSTSDAAVDLPFGGWKSSGIGPAEHGPGNVEFFTRMQAIYR